MLTKIKFWIIKKVFEKYYGNFIYPFETADVKRYKLSPAGQYRYLMDVDTWIKSTAYKYEIEGLIRKFYQELSLTTTDEIQLSAYRLVLIFIKNYENRLLQLQQECNLTEAKHKLDKQLK